MRVWSFTDCVLVALNYYDDDNNERDLVFHQLVILLTNVLLVTKPLKMLCAFSYYFIFLNYYFVFVF